MKVCVYNGSEKLVGKSGVGIAIHHQTDFLTDAGYDVVPRLDTDTSIVHINTVFPGSVLTALRARLLHKTVVYYGHSTMEDFRHSFKGSDLLAPLFRNWIKFCYQLGDVIVTPTEYSKQLLQSYGIQKPILAVSNGIDTGRFVPSREGRSAFRNQYHIPEKKKVILSVGHYIERKGILEFVDMARRMPDTEFFWFGYTDPKLIPQKIQDAVASAPANVHFPGYTPPEQLLLAYQGCDLFCFMSHEETEGIVVLEALACGIPVLVRDIPVYDGWLQDGKNVYKATDTGSFVDLADKILQKSIPDLTKQGRQTAQARSYANIAKKMRLIYARYGKADRSPAPGRPKRPQMTNYSE